MADDTYSLQMAPYDRDRTLDWLTALVPLLLVSVFYYGWRALLLELLAVGGYLVVSALFSGGFATVRLAPALITGLLTAFCLPATTPYWPAALAGGVAALAASVPDLVAKKWPTCPYAQRLVQPAVVGYLAVRLVFPGAVDGFTLPAQWDNLDGLATATPLAALAGEDLQLTSTHLLFGIHAGAIGEGCVAAVGLCALYLLLRRRLRLIAPGAMLTTVLLLSWAMWNSPLYGVLAGGVALGALLLADRACMPKDYAVQAVSGVLAGVVIVLIRAFTYTDGTAVALVAAGLLQPAFPYFLRFCRWVGRKLSPLWPLLVRFGRWLWAVLKPLLQKLGALCLAGLRWLGQRLATIFCQIAEKLRKNKNNG